MKSFLISLMLLVAILIPAVMLGSEGTLTPVYYHGNIKKVDIDWVASTNSGADGSVKRISGTLKRVVFKGDTGSTLPDDNYDVTLKDAEGVDILAGLGANISSNGTTTVCPGLRITTDTSATGIVQFAFNDKLTLTVTNTGSLNAGNVILYYTQE